MRSEAKELANRINRVLYVEGKGYWRAGQPDGGFNEVRHCYDLLSVLDNMSEDLSERQKKEMSHFFWTELYTPAWMRALSSNDVDATWNIRADHSSIGAYPRGRRRRQWGSIKLTHRRTSRGGSSSWRGPVIKAPSARHT